MRLKIVNPSSDYSKVPLIEPTRLGYLYLAASVRPTEFPGCCRAARARGCCGK